MLGERRCIRAAAEDWRVSPIISIGGLPNASGCRAKRRPMWVSMWLDRCVTDTGSQHPPAASNSTCHRVAMTCGGLRGGDSSQSAVVAAAFYAPVPSRIAPFPSPKRNARPCASSCQHPCPYSSLALTSDIIRRNQTQGNRAPGTGGPRLVTGCLVIVAAHWRSPLDRSASALHSPSQFRVPRCVPEDR